MISFQGAFTFSDFLLLDIISFISYQLLSLLLVLSIIEGGRNERLFFFLIVLPKSIIFSIIWFFCKYKYMCVCVFVC